MGPSSVHPLHPSLSAASRLRAMGMPGCKNPSNPGFPLGPSSSLHIPDPLLLFLHGRVWASVGAGSGGGGCNPTPVKSLPRWPLSSLPECLRQVPLLTHTHKPHCLRVWCCGVGVASVSGKISVVVIFHHQKIKSLFLRAPGCRGAGQSPQASCGPHFMPRLLF